MIKLQGIAEQGGVNIITSGVNATTEGLQSFPGCTVTVYNAGTVTPATIYSDNAATPKANPFSSSSTDASWFCYVRPSKYDIRFSGTGITIPFTLSYVVAGVLEYTFEDFGAIGDGVADDTNAINAALAALPSGNKITGRPNAIYSVTGVTATHKYNCQIIGTDSYMGYSDPSVRPAFVFAGTNGGTLITLENCLGTTFSGWALYGSTTPGSSTGSAINLLLSGVTGGTPPISSQNIIRGNLIRQNNTRSGWIGIKLTSAANNEQHRILGNYIEGGISTDTLTSLVGTGISLNEVNQRAIVLRDNFFRTLSTSIEVTGGGFKAYDSVHSAVATIYAGHPTDATQIIGDDGENMGALLDIPIGFGGRWHFLSGRYQDIRDDLGWSSTIPIVSASNGAMIKLENNFISPRGTLGNNLALDENATSSIIMEHNLIDDLTWANLKTALDTFNHRRSLGSITVSSDNTSGIPYFYQDGICEFSGSGSPEGSVPAPIGSVYHRRDGGASTSMYIKTSGTGNTGWTAK